MGDGAAEDDVVDEGKGLLGARPAAIARIAPGGRSGRSAAVSRVVAPPRNIHAAAAAAPRPIHEMAAAQKKNRVARALKPFLAARPRIVA